jgi:hypothetical protein
MVARDLQDGGRCGREHRTGQHHHPHTADRNQRGTDQ